MKAKYICIEGVEGVGKTTQTNKLVDYLRSKGYKVLNTKEPGTPHSPLTMELRNVMLNAKYDDELTVTARELISQAIRSIHLEKVIVPALDEYDFIVQDRGILSGYAYGQACGNPYAWLEDLSHHVADKSGFPKKTEYEKIHSKSVYQIYDHVIHLVGDTKKGLAIAKAAKQEFEAGDAIENKGYMFIDNVGKNMMWMGDRFKPSRILVDNKSIDEVFIEILRAINME